jgi:hypothetical protein
MTTIYKDNPPLYFPQPFQNNSVKAQGYYVTITDGVTTIFRKGKNAAGQDEEVNIGSIAKGGGYTNTSNASKEEIQYFTANARKTITEQAVPVVNRGIGGLAGGGNIKINEVLGTNLATDGSSDSESTGSSRDPAVDPSVDNPTEIKSSTITIGESSGRKDFGSYAYPYDLRTNTQDRIVFTLKEIKGSNITPTFERGKKVIQRNDLGEIKGQVTLPIQSGISDSNSVDWSGSTLNAIQAYAAGSSLTFMGSEDAGELGNNVSNILGKIAQKIKGNTDYGNALKLYLAQEAVGISGLLSRASGAILNPNLELLFNGPQLRPFNFTFRLSPREEKEATEVRSIIRFFKEAMSVRTSSDNIFLKSPLVFDIKYVTYGNDGKPLKNHPSIGRIKTCALLSCDVDYTPDGSYMTFNDGSRTMTSYGLSLRFSELDPIYNTDYYDTENKSNNIPTDNIGY